VIVDARDLTASYPGASRPAVDGVSFTAHPRELLVIAGPNGSGKSTLLRALLGRLPVTRGTVTIGGSRLTDWSRLELARAIGVVAQREESVFPLRVRDMVMLGRYARLGPTGAVRAEDRAAVDRALDRCDAASLASRWVDQLSGGEWQRVRIARALAQEPRMLILDEPTLSLDVRHEMELFELIRQLVDAGLGTIAITHQLNLAARYADRMLLLESGHLAASGTPADVIERSIITRVFRWPVDVTVWRGGAPQIVPLRPSEVPHADQDRP
jgi:ABC-type cobalamin/Fe3+-siderophores transport system ATPase subunit